MKRDTRLEILKIAKKLFNEHGYNEVSTQDIADAMGISKGNLTYHFKKKEQIVEAIIENNSRQIPFPEIPQTLNDMSNLFIHTQDFITENAFYFWNHTQLAQLSPKIFQQQNRMHAKNMDVFAKAFSKFQLDGIFREENFSGEYKRTIDSLQLSCVYWIPFCKLRQTQDPNGSFQCHVWSILYPFLTEKGKGLLSNITYLSQLF